MFGKLINSVKLSLITGSFLAINVCSFASLERLLENVVFHEMENGMRIVVVPRATAPVFTGMIKFQAGSSDELIGESGIAHMTEHMSFKGSKVIGTRDYQVELEYLEELERLGKLIRDELRQLNPDHERIRQWRADQERLTAAHREKIVEGEYDLIMSQNGGVGMNATTATDFTNYFISMPANQLELYMWMESDRFRSPVMREFYSEREVVMEEMREVIYDSPFGRLVHSFYNIAMQAHPYGQPVIGFESDIEAFTGTASMAFRERYYGPRNTVLAIAGDVDPDEVIYLAEKYFGDWDAPGEPNRVFTRDPKPDGEVRRSVTFDANPAIVIGWPKPAGLNRDAVSFDVLSQILTTGRTSRFYQELVMERQVAAQVFSDNGPGNKYDNLFLILAQPRAPHSVFEAEEAIYESLEKILEEGISEAELQRVRNQANARLIYSLRSNTALAETFSTYVHLHGSVDALNEYFDILESLTPEDIESVVREYLKRDRRTVVWLERPSAEDSTSDDLAEATR